MGQSGIVVLIFLLGFDEATVFQYFHIIAHNFRLFWEWNLNQLFGGFTVRKESCCLLCFPSLCLSAGICSLPCHQFGKETLAQTTRGWITHVITTTGSYNSKIKYCHLNDVLLSIAAVFDQTGLKGLKSVLLLQFGDFSIPFFHFLDLLHLPWGRGGQLEPIPAVRGISLNLNFDIFFPK